MKIIDKVLEETLETRKELIKSFCPRDFGFKDKDYCEYPTHLKCKECWNREIREEA